MRLFTSLFLIYYICSGLWGRTGESGVSRGDLMQKESSCQELTGAPQLLDLFLQHQGISRRYLLYIPADYDGMEEWPLVINLHGLGNNRLQQQFLSGMNDVADTAHFLVAYPEGTLAIQPNGRLAPAWNPGLLPERADDVDFIEHLIDTLDQNWAIDENRIYATGMSQGGVMSYLLACNIPDRLAAIASVAGVSVLNIDWTCTADRPMPVLHIHGTADLVSPYNGGIGVLGPDFLFPTVRQQLGYWLDSNECSADSTVMMLPDQDMTDGSTVELRQFQNCMTYVGADGEESVADIWLYTILGGGHTWPGAPAEAIPPGLEQVFGNINRDINASVEIWNFFKRFTLSSKPNAANHLDAAEIALQVFPNPFATELNFLFELSATAEVQIDLYNTLGQPVARIADRSLPAGKHQIQWQANVEVFTPGLYYYQIRKGNRWLSRPVLLGR